MCQLHIIILYYIVLRLRLLDAISSWVERSIWVDLTHATLRADVDAQAELCEWTLQHFPHMDEHRMQNVTYVDALKKSKDAFHCLPRKYMRPSLTSYLQRMLNYLSPGVVLGVRILD